MRVNILIKLAQINVIWLPIDDIDNDNLISIWHNHWNIYIV